MNTAQQNAIKEAEEAGYPIISSSVHDQFKDCLTVILDNGDEYTLMENGQSIMGVTLLQEIQGYWMDPAGGLHSPDREGDFEDPAAMYE